MRLFTKEDRRGLFYRPALWLTGLEERCKRALGVGDRALETFVLLYGAAGGKKACRRYRIRENEKLIAFFLGGTALAAVLFVSGFGSGKGEGITTLKRPESGSKDAVYQMDATVGEQKISDLSVQVPARRLSEEEAQALLTKAEAELDQWMEEPGRSLDALQEDLALPGFLQDGLVEVRWESSRYDLMDSAGHIRNDLPKEDGEVLTLQAVLSCGGTEKIRVYPVRVVPKGQDRKARLTRWIARRMQEQTEREGEAFVSLPEEFEGEPLSFTAAKPAYGLLAAVLTAAGVVLLKAASQKDVQKMRDARAESLAFSYPAFLLRLTLLATSGMPVRTVFFKLAGEGEKPGALPVYEEVLRTVREMESGVTELKAYENFGTRCRLPQYRKCASLLSQNVKKGTVGLMSALGQEADAAFWERKAAAKKKGEEAQTKLLLPLLMMLAVVMILIMAPACFSFGGF